MIDPPDTVHAYTPDGRATTASIVVLDSTPSTVGKVEAVLITLPVDSRLRSSSEVPVSTPIVRVA
jgi:histidinol dehydrogenase